MLFVIVSFNYYKVIMNKNEISHCLDLSDWSEDSSTGGIPDSDEDDIFEIQLNIYKCSKRILLFLILCPTIK